MATGSSQRRPEDPITAVDPNPSSTRRVNQRDTLGECGPSANLTTDTVARKLHCTSRQLAALLTPGAAMIERR
jgi:hypothetical protein